MQVVNGTFTLQLQANEVYTLTTVANGNKGSYPNPPNSSAFPVPYVETFESKSFQLLAFNIPKIVFVYLMQCNALHIYAGLSVCLSICP